MKIVLIGTGNIATLLLTRLAAAHTILQVYGRNHLEAAVLADKCGASTCSSWDTITPHGDLYIIALSDNALTGGEVKLRLTNQLVVHTAGAVSINVLKDISSSYGVLYPYQSIRKELEPPSAVPLLVDANTAVAREFLRTLAESISQRVLIADDMRRMQYHLCAVMTNNFGNFLYVLAEDYCNKHGLDFSLLLPLIDETAHRLHRFSPGRVQTGPAIRKDTDTLARHLTLLQDEPGISPLYKLFSDEILRYPWPG